MEYFNIFFRTAIPRQGVLGDIIITGEAKRYVVAAHNRIMVMVEAARARQEFTHFVSIPFNTIVQLLSY